MQDMSVTRHLKPNSLHHDRLYYGENDESSKDSELK